MRGPPRQRGSSRIWAALSGPSSRIRARRAAMSASTASIRRAKSDAGGHFPHPKKYHCPLRKPGFTDIPQPHQMMNNEGNSNSPLYDM